MAGQRTSLNHTGKLIVVATARALPLVCLALLAVWLIWSDPHGDESTPTTDTDSPAIQRATACEEAPRGYLIAHTSDTDWRVRAAAYEALSKIAPIDNVPLRDTPIDEREAVMLAWLDRHASVLAADLCEVYAQADDLRFGRTLVQRCMPCHAGPEPATAISDSRCAECHPMIHSQFAGNAHANSLSHLKLITIDPTTRQPQAFDFKDRKGLSCAACHQPEDGAESAITDGQNDNGCIAPFSTYPCATCHTQAQTQWEAWRNTPRLQRTHWPPGSIEQATGEPASCVDCHMPDSDHLLAARRDTSLLLCGIRLAVSRDAHGRALLTLQNMAGHAYPTGTTRRALHLYAQTDDGSETLIAVLADASPETPDSPDAPTTQPAMEPNEQRRFALPGRPTRVSARVVYLRNRFQPDSYSVQVTSIEQQFAEEMD